MNKLFNKFSSVASSVYGRGYTFTLAIFIILVWAFMGVPLKFSDTWHLLINTPTTIITFLGVFLIQNTQNRDNVAMQVKLDLIMKHLKIDTKDIRDLENKPDVELEKIQAKVQKKGKK